MKKRFRLLQARLPNDLVLEEERPAFADQLDVGLDQIASSHLLTPDIRYESFTHGADVLLVGGSGAFGVQDKLPWVSTYIDTLAEVADRGFPMFASCFGFQALVMGLGGHVEPDPERSEVGSFEIFLEPDAADDPIFQDLPATFVAQQGHKDRAYHLPTDLVHLARSELCPYQAVRMRGKPIWATQFHPELTGDENRKGFSRYLPMYAKAFGQAGAQRILEAFNESPEANDLLRRFKAHIADDI